MGTLLRVRRSAARDGAAGRGARRHAADVAHRAVVARRSVPAAGRHRPARRGGAVAAAGRRSAPPAPDAPARRRAPTSCTCAPTSWRAPTTALAAARDLYQQCLELDPRFAPAWARLGRCHRVIGKYIDADARQRRSAPRRRFRRALALNPRLSVAHKFYANLEADIGQARAGAACGCSARRRCHGNDPELFAGLVHACRYCGLFEQSIAAHAEARRLDPERRRPASSRRC